MLASLHCPVQRCAPQAILSSRQRSRLILVIITALLVLLMMLQMMMVFTGMGNGEKQ